MTNAQIQASIEDLRDVVEIDLPAEVSARTTNGLRLTWAARTGGRKNCEVVSHQIRDQKVLSVDIRLDDQTLIRIATHRLVAPDDYAFLVAEAWSVLNGCLVPSGTVKWSQQSPIARNLNAMLRDAIKASWKNGLILRTNLTEGDGNGLRVPQAGALHALAAHWSIKKTSALVVMPTGTGKTDTMIAAMVMRSRRRTLVLVPSGVLRTQLTEKFQSLGVLRQAGVLTNDVLNPIVGVLRVGTALSDDIESCRLCNVIVSTVAMIDRGSDEDVAAFLKLFDVVFVDEVHHAPADSWKRILDKAAESSLVGFSATPFREDAKRIPGSVIYNFPLKLAQDLDYFKKIEPRLVDEPDSQVADRVIAEAAVMALREDEARGYIHVILARTSTRKHADDLLRNVYGPRFSELNPVALYSGIAGKAEIIDGIRRGHHRIIVCVDMFGEGFDMPSLKIAALHVVHKSLAITLQFVGRFTRSGPLLGTATVVANLANARLPYALQELYSESADWQELLPRLIDTAIGNETQSEEFGATTKLQALPEKNLFDLFSLRPALSAVFFRTNSFNAAKVEQSLPKNCILHAQWISEDRNLVICVTRSKRSISWASAREAADEVWELWLIAFDPTRKLLYLNVSPRSSLNVDFAKRITGGSALLVAGEVMFRAFNGVNRLALYNVGLYGRGRLRYRMFVGRDVAEQITSANQANNSKSNLFGSGYERGARTSIGVSHKGRAWSMEAVAIPVWREWCNHVADKITDAAISTDEFLKHTLNPRPATVLPPKTVLAVMLPDAWTIEDMTSPTIAIGSSEIGSCRDLHISLAERRGDSLVVALDYNEVRVVELQLSWGPAEEQQRFTILSGPQHVVVDGAPVTWTDYLTEHPFSVLFEDGSELLGGIHMQRGDGLDVLPFDTTHAKAVNWGTTPLAEESKWKDGQLRNESVQGYWIEELLREDSQVIFDDDGANESADIVEIKYNDRDIVCRLYHCKYSLGAVPGIRVDDVQEVCAQAARSAKWAAAPESLIDHLQLRQAEGRRGRRPTRFERGSLRDLTVLKRLLARRHFHLQIYVVQPGLSIQELSGSRNITAVLGACDNFVHELTGHPLTVIASA